MRLGRRPLIVRLLKAGRKKDEIMGILDDVFPPQLEEFKTSNRQALNGTVRDLMNQEKDDLR